MLKGPKIVPISTRRPPPQPQGLLLDSSFQTPANPPAPSGSPAKWQAYVNGGAKADDARMLNKRREQEAAFEEQLRNSTPHPRAAADADAGPSRLVETSPQKAAPSVSGNTSLLIDLDIKSTYGAYSQQSPEVSPTSAAESKKPSYSGSQWTLLD